MAGRLVGSARAALDQHAALAFEHHLIVLIYAEVPEGDDAGVLSIGLAHLMKPIYPGLLSLPISVAWPVIPVAVVIAVISSFVGVRRAISVDPSQAFG